MLNDVYNKRILELAAEIPHLGRLPHPDASATNPQTFPKFMPQFDRVVAYRDMVNWCIENPQGGKALDVNGEDMIALEAYSFYLHKGVPIETGLQTRQSFAGLHGPGRRGQSACWNAVAARVDDAAAAHPERGHSGIEGDEEGPGQVLAVLVLRN